MSRRTLCAGRSAGRPHPPAGIEHTFHDLRKRGAALAIAKTRDIYAVSKAFGWASIETASAYAAVSDDTLDAIAEAMV